LFPHRQTLVLHRHHILHSHCTHCTVLYATFYSVLYVHAVQAQCNASWTHFLGAKNLSKWPLITLYAVPKFDRHIEKYVPWNIAHSI
jgi:hypothetical protein